MIRRPPRSTRTDTLFPTRRASDLRVTALGTGLNFGVPISEYDRIFAGVSFEHNEISDFKESAPKAYEDFVDEYGEKTNSFIFNVGWSKDTRDSAIAPTRGDRKSVV